MKIPPVWGSARDLLSPRALWGSARARRPRGQIFITGAGWAVPASSPELQAKIDAYLSRGAK